MPRFSGKLVPAVLESLISSAEVTLPPVNWAAVLSPILKANFGKLNQLSSFLHESTRKLNLLSSS